jgi:peptide/nickel transport system substrate-binding protein
MRMLLKAAVAAVLLAGTSAGALAVERGGELRYGRYADSLFLDPVLNDANVDIWILTNLYDTLLQPSADGTSVEPGLATAWKVSDDGLSVTLTLREGTKFSDGKPITAEDVKWSLDRARNPKNGIWNSLIASIAEVMVQDPTTVVLKLQHPDPTIVAALSTFNTAIMPKAAFEATPGATDDEKAHAFAEHPVGSGPFMFDKWERGSSMRLVRNPNYWKPGEDGKPLPYLDAVDFEIVPDDATRILKLQSGELDGAEFIPYARVAELKGDADLQMQLFPSTRVQFVTMNVRPKLTDGSDNPLANEKVRQALNYAVDKDAIIQIVTHGVGTPQTSFMASTTLYHSGDAPLYPYDPAKAKQLLQEAGFGDGFSTKVMALPGNQDQLGIGAAVQQMWDAIGVKLEIEQVDNATLTDRYRKGDFSMRMSAWTNDINDPSQITSYFAYSPVIDALHSGWKNQEVDTLFEASQKESDAKKRAEQYARIQKIYAESGPILYLYETPYPVALRKNVQGFVQIPLGNNIFAGAYLTK